MGAAGPDRGDGGRASDKTCWCSDPESTLDKLLKYEKRRTRGDFEWIGKKGREESEAGRHAAPGTDLYRFHVVHFTTQVRMTGRSLQQRGARVVPAGERQRS